MFTKFDFPRRLLSRSSNSGQRTCTPARGGRRRANKHRQRRLLLEPLETRILLASDLGDAPTSSATLGAIYGQKFEDLNANGRRDPNEPGLDGFTIFLMDLQGNVLDSFITTSMELDGVPGIDPITERGLYQFLDVAPGEYLIAEMPQAGWSQTMPRSDTYRITVEPGQVIGTLPAVAPVSSDPDPNWVDRMVAGEIVQLMTVLVDVDIDFDGISDGVFDLSGMTRIAFSDPIDTDDDGIKDQMDTEITEMFLAGVAPVGPTEVRLGSPQSLGQVNQDPGSTFADSFFDVFVEIDTVGIFGQSLTLHNVDALRMVAEEPGIAGIPPYGAVYRSDLDEPLPLYWDEYPEGPQAQLLSVTLLPLYGLDFGNYSEVVPGSIHGYKFEDVNGNGVREWFSTTDTVDLPPAAGVTVDEFYAENYQAFDLGTPEGVPSAFGGLTLKFDDPNTLIIGGSANTEDGKLYAVPLQRDASGHIVGFAGPATVFTEAAYNDGGVAYGPDNVLFVSRWPVNELGQIKPGSTTTDKIIDLNELTAYSHAAINFVPNGFPGAGLAKLVSWPDGEFSSASLSPDGSGTFDLFDITQTSSLVGGPEGFVFVPTASPQFDTFSMLVSEYSAGSVSSYELDESGDPIPETRQDFLTGLTGAEGAFIDPFTGDFLFSTFGGGDRIVQVRGFAATQTFAEPPIANVTITLVGDVDGDGTMNTWVTTTDQNGEYHFEGLHPGEYTVTETPPPGTAPTTPTSFTVTVGSGQALVAWPGQAQVTGPMRLFAALPGDPQPIVELDPVTGDELNRFFGSEPATVAWDGLAFDGINLWYGNGTSLCKLNPDTGEVQQSYSLTFSASGLAFLNGSIFITDITNNNILEFDPVSETIVRTLDIDGVNPTINVHLGPGLSGITGLDALIAINQPLDSSSPDVLEINPETGQITNWFDIVHASPPAFGAAVVDGQIYLGFGDTSETMGVYDREGNLLRTIETSYSSIVALGGDDVRADLANSRIEVMVGPILAFGNVFLGSIHGFKFEDVNVNGEWDMTTSEVMEPGKFGVEFHLTGTTGTGETVDLMTTTDANGFFSFEDLSPGQYTVTEIVPEGWVASTPESYPFQLLSGQHLVAFEGQADLPSESPGIEVIVGAELMFGNHPEFDFGDAPDGEEWSYRTLLVNDGARHRIVPGFHLGAGIDGEEDGQPVSGAHGDDVWDGNDDEDGVFFTNLWVPGQIAMLDVIASAAGYLDAWVDFGLKGYFDEEADKVFSSKPLAAGVNSLQFTIPLTAANEADFTYARFRFSSTGGLASYGEANDGEVEDYMVAMEPVAWESSIQLEKATNGDDADDPTGPYILVGDTVTWTYVVTNTGNVPLSDVVVTDDELGEIGTIGSLAAGASETLTMTGTAVAGQYANLGSVVGYFGDVLVGDQDPSHYFGVAASIQIEKLTNGYDADEPSGPAIPVISGSTVTWTYVITNTGNVPLVDVQVVDDPEQQISGPTGDDGNGVLDPGETWEFTASATPLVGQYSNTATVTAMGLLEVEVSDSDTSHYYGYEMDFGDAPLPYPTLLEHNGARHRIVPGYHLGLLIDAELDGQPSPNADGDDMTGLNDEDGVVLPPLLIRGELATVTVIASAEGVLNAWIDFNRDGDWADPGEQIFVDQPLFPGENELSFAVPMGGFSGDTYARFRFNSVGGLSYDGPAGDGEVEDYLVSIGLPDRWRFDFNAPGSPTQTPVPADPDTGIYTGVVPSHLFSSAAGFGWVTSPSGFDRGTRLPDSLYSFLLRDGAWHSSSREFGMLLAQGDYEVTVTLGDASFARDRMNVYVCQGSGVGLSNIATPAGQFSHHTFTASPDENGFLGLIFSNGGGDPYWTVNAVEVRPVVTPFTVTAPIGPAEADGVTVLDYTVEGATAGAVYTVAATSGASIVNVDGILIEDADRYAGIQIVAPSGDFTLGVQSPSSAGNVTVTLAEVNGASRGAVTRAYSLPALRRFDFDGSGVYTQTDPDFTSVRASTLYTAAAGYGWMTSPSEFQRTDSGILEAWPQLYRDGHWGSASRTFQVQVDADQQYDVLVYTGDRNFPRNNLQITVEGAAPVVVSATAANQFIKQVISGGEDMNGDGKLDITFANLGGDPYWVINGVDLALATSSGGPGLPELPPTSEISVEVDLEEAFEGDPPDEGTTVTFTVSMDRIQPYPVTVAYLIGGTATPGVDFVNVASGDYSALAGGTITFAPGEQSKSIVLQVVPDTDVEDDETVIVTLSSPTAGATIDAGAASATHTILNDDDPPPLPASWRFDFGTSSSPVDTAFTQVGATNAYNAELGYGWQTNASTFNRSGPTALLRDGHWGTNNTFLVDIPNGNYVVNVTVGDANFARNNISVWAEESPGDPPKLIDLASAAGRFVHESFEVEVADGQLNVRIASTGGDPYFTINALEIWDVAQLDHELETTDGGVTFQGTGTPGALITVTTTLGSISGTGEPTPYAGHQVVADGSGNFSFRVTPPGAGDWVMIRTDEVTGLGKGNAPYNYDVPAVRRFDFNGSGNDTLVSAGFIGVRGNQAYNANNGYGWTQSVLEFQRGTTGYSVQQAHVPLYRDGHWGTAARTFQVAVEQGESYQVRVYVGDRNFTRNNIQVTVEDAVPIVIAPTTANQFRTAVISGSDANHDGILTVTIANLGGDPYWVINGIDVWTGGEDNDPGAVNLLAATWGSQMVGQWLTEDALNAVVPVARQYWVSTGLADWQVAELHRTPIAIGDLSYREALGVARPEGIWLDASGAGLGWAVGGGPWAVGGGPLFGGGSYQSTTDNWRLTTAGYDLLTVLTHELGHVIGYDDLDPLLYPDHVMAGVLQPGVSRIALPTDARHVAADLRDAVSPSRGPVVDRALDDLLDHAPRAAGDRWADREEELERLIRTTANERYEELDDFFARL